MDTLLARSVRILLNGPNSIYAVEFCEEGEFASLLVMFQEWGDSTHENIQMDIQCGGFVVRSRVIKAFILSEEHKFVLLRFGPASAEDEVDSLLLNKQYFCLCGEAQGEPFQYDVPYRLKKAGTGANGYRFYELALEVPLVFLVMSE